MGLVVSNHFTRCWYVSNVRIEICGFKCNRYMWEGCVCLLRWVLHDISYCAYVPIFRCCIIFIVTLQKNFERRILKASYRLEFWSICVSKFLTKQFTQVLTDCHKTSCVLRTIKITGVMAHTAHTVCTVCMGLFQWKYMDHIGEWNLERYQIREKTSLTDTGYRTWGAAMEHRCSTNWVNRTASMLLYPRPDKEYKEYFYTDF